MSLEPDGLVLNSPVTVTIPFDPAALNSGGGIVLPDFLGVFLLDPHTGQKVFQDTFRVDTVQNVLVGTLDHFSEYEPVIMRRLCPPPTGGVLCPTTYTEPSVPSKYLPALLVHGFRFGGMGDEATWGDLRTLLGIPPPSVFPFFSDPQDRIGAWRFDYYSIAVSFRTNAYALAKAIAEIKRVTHRPAVNVVAHSFGGILARTYLQDMGSADGTGNPAGFLLAYQNDVNKLMTLGTPHRGIGSTGENDFSRAEADWCARRSTETDSPTCFEAATADPNKGALLRALNANSPPHDLRPLRSAKRPQYQVIIGQRFDFDLFSGDDLRTDDGLIKTSGADICAALGGLAAVGDGTSCSNNTNISVRKIANSASGPMDYALCHTNSLGVDGCGRQRNMPMAEVTTLNKNHHPSWTIIPHGRSYVSF
jgi:hypothetical protein